MGASLADCNMLLTTYFIWKYNGRVADWYRGKRAEIVKRLFFIGCLYFLVLADGFGADLPQRIATKDGFTIHVPDDWIQIPKHVLDAYSETISKAAPQAQKQIFDYGFQKLPVDTWLTHPYLLIQVRRED